ncbi:MAG: hypothetical protein R3C41_16340 [Calditrichia bacterium]
MKEEKTFRVLTTEFKKEAVKLVIEGDEKIAEVESLTEQYKIFIV